MLIKPILFNTDMVRAVLDERKTVTRRAIKPPYYIDDEEVCCKSGTAMHKGTDVTHGMPYPDSFYIPNSIIYVRETWAKGGFRDDRNDWKYYYKADKCNPPLIKWCPSIHMPKEAARIFLHVTDVRIERLQDIDDEGAKAEGANYGIGISDKMKETAIDRFAKIWNNTIRKNDLLSYGWDADPWVWVIEFERCEKPIDF